MCVSREDGLHRKTNRLCSLLSAETFAVSVLVSGSGTVTTLSRKSMDWERSLQGHEGNDRLVS